MIYKGEYLTKQEVKDIIIKTKAGLRSEGFNIDLETNIKYPTKGQQTIICCPGFCFIIENDSRLRYNLIIR